MASVNWQEDDLEYVNLVHSQGNTNCPNCGAPIESERCPYCGTVFIDFASMDADKPFYMKIKQNGEVFIVKVRLNSMEITQGEFIEYIDGFRSPFTTMIRRGPSELDAHFTIIA